MAINVFLSLFKLFNRNSYIYRQIAKINSQRIVSAIKYGSRWNHSSRYPCLCVPWSIGLGAESIGMGI